MNEISPQRRILVQSLAAAGILMSAFGINRAASASGNSSLNYKTLIPAEGYAFNDYSGKLHKITFQRRPVGDDDVAIEIRAWWRRSAKTSAASRWATASALAVLSIPAGIAPNAGASRNNIASPMAARYSLTAIRLRKRAILAALPKAVIPIASSSKNDL